MIFSWTWRGRWSQTSSGPYGLFEQDRRAGLGLLRTSYRSRKPNW